MWEVPNSNSVETSFFLLLLETNINKNTCSRKTSWLWNSRTKNVKGFHIFIHLDIIFYGNIDIWIKSWAWANDVIKQGTFSLIYSLNTFNSNYSSIISQMYCIQILFWDQRLACTEHVKFSLEIVSCHTLHKKK